MPKLSNNLKIILGVIALIAILNIDKVSAVLVSIIGFAIQVAVVLLIIAFVIYVYKFYMKGQGSQPSQGSSNTNNGNILSGGQPQQQGGNYGSSKNPIENFIALNSISSVYFLADKSDLAFIKANDIRPKNNQDAVASYKEYVRLTFCRDIPQRKLDLKGESLVLLEVDSSILLLEGVLFSNKNILASGAVIRGGKEGVSQIDYGATQRKYVSKYDPDYDAHWAEILVPNIVPVGYIKNIDSSPN